MSKRDKEKEKCFALHRRIKITEFKKKKVLLRRVCKQCSRQCLSPSEGDRAQLRLAGRLLAGGGRPPRAQPAGSCPDEWC